MTGALRPIDGDLEPGLSDSVQVVRESLGVLLHRVHSEGQTEILGQALDGHEEVTRQSILDGPLVPEIDLVAFEEGRLGGLGNVQCGTYSPGPLRARDR